MGDDNNKKEVVKKEKTLIKKTNTSVSPIIIDSDDNLEDHLDYRLDLETNINNIGSFIYNKKKKVIE